MFAIEYFQDFLKISNLWCDLSFSKWRLVAEQHVVIRSSSALFCQQLPLVAASGTDIQLQLTHQLQSQDFELFPNKYSHEYQPIKLSHYYSRNELMNLINDWTYIDFIVYITFCQ